MSQQSLSMSMAEAWVARAQSAATDLRFAEQAPALFRPEYVAEREQDYRDAVRWAQFWQGQAVSA